MKQRVNGKQISSGNQIISGKQISSRNQIISWIKSSWPPIAVVFSLLLGWQVGVTLANTPQWLLPSPLHILQEVTVEWPKLQVHLISTIQLISLGYVVGCVFGVLIGFFLHHLPWARSGLYPLLVVSQNIPIIALAPLLMIWFGFGVVPKLLVILLICFFPVSVNLLDGLRQTDRSSYHYLQMIGASKKQIFFKLEFPYALPYLFSGLKISATYSVMGAVIAEWLGSFQGIGVYMLLSKNSFQTDHVFLAIGLIVILALGLNGLISLIEHAVIRWNKKG